MDNGNSESLSKEERDLLVSRIDCGYLRYKTNYGILQIRSPSKDINYEAGEIYKEIIDSYDHILPEKYIIGVLFHEGVWTEDMDHEWLVLPKEIDNIKVEIYKQFFSNTDKLRKSYRIKNKRLIELSAIRHKWDKYTLEGIATFAKNYYIITQTTYLNNELYNFSDLNGYEVLNYKYNQYISEDHIRELSRTDPWLSIYENRKNGIIFPNETEDQLRLLSYTLMYNNVRENPDCPHEDILKDNLAFDGWIIEQKRKRDKEKKRADLDSKMSSKIANCQEVLVPASNNTTGQAFYNDTKYADEIDSLNDEQASVVKKQRLKDSENKELHVLEMRDVRQKIQMQINNQKR